MLRYTVPAKKIKFGSIFNIYTLQTDTLKIDLFIQQLFSGITKLFLSFHFIVLKLLRNHLAIQMTI